jgi:hypothetical protein
MHGVTIKKKNILFTDNESFSCFTVATANQGKLVYADKNTYKRLSYLVLLPTHGSMSFICVIADGQQKWSQMVVT